MLDAYRTHVAERQALGIPPLPLAEEQVRQVTALLEKPPAGTENLLVELISQRVSPGVDDGARVKAEWLASIVAGRVVSPLIAPARAVELLATMGGGYNVPPLVEALSGPHATIAADGLARTILVFDAFTKVEALAKAGNRTAHAVLERWADAEWRTSRPELPAAIRATVYRIAGETNTDDLSPAQQAPSRPDIPLHALAMYERRDPSAVPWLRAARASGTRVIVCGDVFGTGSSRKSATNSLLWWIGEDIPGVPNKRRGGVLLSGIIAPIFHNTMRDAGGLPIQVDTSSLQTGDIITVRPQEGVLLKGEREIARFRLEPASLADEYRAGGRTNLIIGQALSERAAAALHRPITAPLSAASAAKASGGGFTLAQKLVGKACGRPGVFPGETCQPRMETVGSQDTTGPMTADELKELACLRYEAGLVMQSFCHTAAYPTTVDVKMQKTLPAFMASRGGVALRPGDGVIHSWLNRMILPDGVGTGGDSHTRFPLGISFPAGSGLVAFAAALGFMPLDMPESVLVRFRGSRRPDITVRDMVNAIPYAALQSGDLTVGEGERVNVFAGRILEIEGVSDLPVEEAFEFANASAERSAAASTVALHPERVAEFLRSNLVLLKSMVADGYADAEALTRRIAAMETWLNHPHLVTADADARYHQVFEIDASAITEPLIACPNDPDKIQPLSRIAGERIDEVFVGSCMVHVGNLRAAAAVLTGSKTEYAQVPTWICPPTRMDLAALREEGTLAKLGAMGCRIEVPGCSLCMGNQARVRPGATVFATSTRNFSNRMGRDARVYLGSAELAAVCALLGRIPTVAEYRECLAKTVLPKRETLYAPLDFRKAWPGIAKRK